MEVCIFETPSPDTHSPYWKQKPEISSPNRITTLRNSNDKVTEILETEIQGIHKTMVRFIWIIQLIPHHSFVYALY